MFRKNPRKGVHFIPDLKARICLAYSAADGDGSNEQRRRQEKLAGGAKLLLRGAKHKRPILLKNAFQ